jgi:flagellar FliL protein
MADVDDDELEEEGSGESEEGDGEGGPKKGGKLKLIIIIAAVLLIIAGGAAAAFFTGLLDPLLGMDENAEQQSQGAGASGTAQAVFFDLPEMLVNLNTGERKATFLKIRVSLELEKGQDIPRIQAIMPRIVDNFQVYLRELRLEDLKGSAGMYRLREELLTRVNAAAHPTKINDVLFKEMLVQ